MILDLVYINRDVYIFNQLKFKFVHLTSILSSTSLYIRGFDHLVNTLTFIESIIKLIILTKLKFI